MSQRLPSPLPRFDRNLLRTVEKLVPRAEREEWSRAWQAELWYVRHPSRNRPNAAGVVADLAIGLVCDALWLRTDCWRRGLSGTAAFCVGSLVGLVLFSVLVALALNGSWHTLSVNLADQFKRFLIEAPLVVFVSFAIAPRSYIQQGSTSRKHGIKRRGFFAAKALLILLLAFLASADVCWPVHALLPITAELVQTFLFVFLALVGLRWAFLDQEQRCKQCLRALTMPTRVGRPSHNFLEWSGTELSCKQGHGLLSVPEMETSWCQSSRWLDQNGDWDLSASI